ncbi:helix-turn-helix domain-containing protein [Paenibacillus aquistagni]|uniref:helix-turn-helix domain-containing protein n=1 Tax=Paenibacillus aquistagni TaxID=1852522 RepID=UPI00145A93EB|nr:helix-turn-helix transcriptional regulator [Paenibacillus aquistagni]NMM52126.1 helix-turn-helix transcriptional regulator [Paenibacillus aquistagni]
MSLTEKLNELMEIEGINRAELSKGSGVPYTTIVALFDKGADNIKLSTLRKLADYFGVSLDDLAGTKKEDVSREYTIAAHHDGETWTKEELEEIERFKEFVKMRREQRNKE